MGVTVHDDAIPEEVLDFDVAVEVLSGVSRVVNVDFSDFHITGSECGGLAGDDVAKLSRSLEGIEVLDEEVFFLQLVNGESHSHGDDKRHTFGDANNEESDGGRGEIDGTVDRGGVNESVVAGHDEDEPDDTEKDESNDTEGVGVSSNDTSEDFELGLEGSKILLNLKGVLVVLEVVLDLLFLEGVLTNGENDSLAGTGHNNRVLEEDGIRVLVLVLLDIVVRALFDGHFRVIDMLVELLLVNLHVHLFDADAVSWDAVALVEVDDVTNNKVRDVDSLASAVLATEDSHFFVHDFLAESQELLLLTPITEGLDGGGEENSEVNRDTLDPLALLTSEDTQ